MSTLQVTIEPILDVMPHPNADRLDLVTVRGWSCVVPRGAFRLGDKCIYFPIDSVLPIPVEEKIFPPDSKVTLHNHRVKTIRLRGMISQGLVVEPELFGLEAAELGYDLTAVLGVEKYEPPAPGFQTHLGGKRKKRRVDNPDFPKYDGIENAKNHPNLFDRDDWVTVTEKIHGTNFRAGWAPYHANTLWRRMKRWLGLAPKYEFVFGSHNVQLEPEDTHTFYDQNVYAQAVAKYKLKEVLKPGEIIYGEIYGDGIQKNYTYGCEKGEHRFVAFDLLKDGTWAGFGEFYDFIVDRKLPSAPLLYVGKYDYTRIKGMVSGPSVLCPEQKVREGVVVKTSQPIADGHGRKILKFISDEYLLRDQSDFH